MSGNKSVEYVHEYKLPGCDWSPQYHPRTTRKGVAAAVRQARKLYPKNKQRLVKVTTIREVVKV